MLFMTRVTQSHATSSFIIFIIFLIIDSFRYLNFARYGGSSVTPVVFVEASCGQCKHSTVDVIILP